MKKDIQVDVETWGHRDVRAWRYGDTGTWGRGALVDPPVPRSRAEPEAAFLRLISRLFSLLGKGGEREGNEDRCR